MRVDTYFKIDSGQSEPRAEATGATAVKSN
jgi:hypothetical protein